jgi:hypothetical protein
MRSGTVGPCTGCGASHERYGPGGGPLCPECFPSSAAATRQAQAEAELELSLF